MVAHVQGMARDNVAIEYFLEHLEQKLSPYKVNVMVRSFDQMSSFANSIIRRTNERLPCHNHEGASRTVNDMVAFNNTNTRRNSSVSGMKDILERTSLFMGILEIKHEVNVLHEMITLMKDFIALNSLTRGKYVIHLVSNIEFDLRHFFRLAWSWKFLDLTVIKWTQEELGVSKNGIKSSQVMDYRGLVCIYNPYNDSLSKGILTAGAELFPDKLRNVNGHPLRITTLLDPLSRTWPPPELNSWSALSHLEDVNLMKTLFDCLNATLKIANIESFQHQVPKPDFGNVIDRFAVFGKTTVNNEDGFYSHFIQFTRGDSDQRQSDQRVREFLLENYPQIISYPRPVKFHIHFMRLKTYEKRISTDALLAFGGLFFTAAIFAAWVHLLRFKEPNWSFLNILTAQMGGSIQNNSGQMRLSEMIFQMSIYVSTFIVVTIGTDYMLQIFVLEQKLPDIKTLRDLADSNLDFVIEGNDNFMLSLIPRDEIMFKIIKRTKYHYLWRSKTHSFCNSPSHDQPVLDEDVNLCISMSSVVRHISESNSKFQVDTIETPVATLFNFILTNPPPNLIKDRADELICKFHQVGLIDKWENEKMRIRMERKISEESFRDSEEVKANKNEEIPLHQQVFPIFVVGCAAATIALIGEFIWKALIEKTTFGKLVAAYYYDLHSSSGEKIERSDQLMRVLLADKKENKSNIQKELKKKQHTMLQSRRKTV
ncbi:hypothetical protein QAD02_023040 [Eretmocerus hayati]|uniref:Uncharacterized protein n=1 Tax=Eretmocerus hayati TaxID=131215 RepID=A0ACC2PUN2_9HYME|nr:hypothetical protein QAD02_023040 [Eretmocerus hayati]